MVRRHCAGSEAGAPVERGLLLPVSVGGRLGCAGREGGPWSPFWLKLRLTREALSNGAVFVELIGVLFRRLYNEIEAHIYLKGSGMSSRSLLPCHLLSLMLEHSWLVYIWSRPVATRSERSLPGSPCW